MVQRQYPLKHSLHHDELDLRKEMLELFDGDDFGNKKYNILVYRRRRVDSSGNAIKCGTCWNPISNEGKIDCPDCHGAGYLWDEELLRGRVWISRSMILSKQEEFKSNVGRSENSDWLIAIPYPISVFAKDVIYEPKVNDDGSVVFPLSIDKKYYIAYSKREGFDTNKLDYTLLGVSST